MKKLLLIIPELCTGCCRCTYACSEEKEGLVIPSMSRIQVSNFPLNGFSTPNICFQCDNAACVEICPVEAVSYRDGAVQINSEECIGCGDCVNACEWGMIKQNSAGIAFKCNLCDGNPTCVKECEAGALIFAKPNKQQLENRESQMLQRSNSETPLEKHFDFGQKLMSMIRE